MMYVSKSCAAIPPTPTASATTMSGCCTKIARACSGSALAKAASTVTTAGPGPSGATGTTRTTPAGDYAVVGEAVRGRLPILVRLANYGKALEADSELALLDYIGARDRRGAYRLRRARPGRLSIERGGRAGVALRDRLLEEGGVRLPLSR